MRIMRAEHLGMCFGVRDAVARARGIERPAEITIFGQLVHNPVVQRELAGRGFSHAIPIGGGERRDTSDQLRRTVLITAHGISDADRVRLLEAGHALVDTTCPLVKKAHAAALALARDGYFVVVAGRRNHVEVCGLTGDLAPDAFAVVEAAEDVTAYGAQRIGVMAQTTTVADDFARIVQRVRAENPAAEVRCIDTICQPTRDRQMALETLLPKVDLLVVVGGRDSNNTRQLVARACAAGVRAVHVEDAAELEAKAFLAVEAVGLTAGTSTLPETVAAVEERLRCIASELCKVYID